MCSCKTAWKDYSWLHFYHWMRCLSPAQGDTRYFTHIKHVDNKMWNLIIVISVMRTVNITLCYIVIKSLKKNTINLTNDIFEIQLLFQLCSHLTLSLKYSRLNQALHGKLKVVSECSSWNSQKKYFWKVIFSSWQNYAKVNRFFYIFNVLAGLSNGLLPLLKPALSTSICMNVCMFRKQP